MTQIVLKPDTPATDKAEVHRPISPWEMAQGKVLDLSWLLPGDLILFSALAPHLTQEWIRKVQSKGGYPSEHARWEHAAMYIDKGVLCEATRKGVQRAMLADYFGTHLIRARRNFSLTKDKRWEVAVEALSLQGYSYGFKEIVHLFLRAKSGYWNKAAGKARLPYPRRAVICSQLYAKSYATVTKHVIGNADGNESTPASLSAEQSLNDVRLYWLEIIPGSDD